MKPIGLGPGAAFYRVLSPPWSFQPTSGAGAARNGGRFNRPGVAGLYLSREPETALAEYRQIEPIERAGLLIKPGTLVTILVTLDRVVDFSGGYRRGVWPAAWADFACDWKYLARIAGVEPPS